VRYWKPKLALFFTVQTVAVAAMISLVRAARQPDCGIVLECTGPSAASMILAISLIVGELAVVAAALRNDQPVWHALVGLGLISLVTAFVFGIVVAEMERPLDVSIGLSIWHVVVGLILLLAGAAAAFWRLLEKLRRPDAPLPDDLQSSAMWPLD